MSTLELAIENRIPVSDDLAAMQRVVDRREAGSAYRLTRDLAAFAAAYPVGDATAGTKGAVAAGVIAATSGRIFRSGE